MKPSSHSLIHFLPFLLIHHRLPSPELDPVLDNSNFTAHSTTEHLFITTLHGPRRKHSFYCKGEVFTDSLPTSGHPIVAPACFLGNVFTESLSSNEYTRHNIEMGLKQIDWEVWSGFILLTLETIGGLVNTVTDDRIPRKQGDFMLS
jgi:hypothetical protein